MMKAEQEMEIYAALAMNSRDMMALLDCSYTYLGANQAYMDAFGFTKDQVFAHTISEVFGEEFFVKSIKPVPTDASQEMKSDTRHGLNSRRLVHGS
jgi:PAS domain S-box-containing protein